MTDNMNIQWYPGHMTKTRRQIEADLKLVDAVCEIVDARIPVSSRNPDIDAICGDKPRMIVLNRMDLADPAATKKWAEYFRRKGMAVIATDCKSKKGISAFTPAARLACAEKLERDAKRGMNRPLRVMVVGIPNVGKSTLINQISGRKSAKAENRPGVTRGKQWVTVDSGLQLLDTPGHVDFSTETERTLQVLDYAVLVISGREGVQGHTVTLWKLLQKYEIPVFLFINKMDLEGADRAQILEELQSSLSAGCLDFEDPEEEQAAMCEEGLLEEYLEKRA